jgi:hypothetical protein
MTLHALGFQFDTDHSPRPTLEDSVNGPLMRVDCGTGYSLRAMWRIALPWVCRALLMVLGLLIGRWLA